MHRFVCTVTNPPYAGRQAEVRTAAGVETFDFAVLAVHSDTALALRDTDATELETSVLQAVPYNVNDVYLHSGAIMHRTTCWLRSGVDIERCWVRRGGRDYHLLYASR